MQAAQPTRTSDATHWAQIGESTCVVGLWLLYQLYRRLGRWPFLVCLYPVVACHWLARPMARRASLQYLQRLQQAHGLWPRMPQWWHSLKHFRVFAQVILDKLLAVTQGYPTGNVRFEGQQSVLYTLAQGQGAILVTAHMGCMELCQALARQCSGLRLTVLVHTRHAERFNRLLRRMAPDGGVQLMQVSDFNMATAMLLAERVARGEFIAIAGDRVPVHGGQTTRARFLGHEAAFPCGPYVLAALLRCPLYFMGCVREGRGYVVDFKQLADRVELPRASRAQALAAYARRYAQQLERLVCKSPYDWFNFFPFWEQGMASSAAATPPAKGVNPP